MRTHNTKTQVIEPISVEQISTEEIMKDILSEVMVKINQKKMQAKENGEKFIEDESLLKELFKRN